MVAAGLLSAVAIAYLQPVSADAEKPVCVGYIHEFEPGKIRIRNADGKSEKVESSSLTQRESGLCVIEVVTDKPQYKVHIPDGTFEGEWFVKRRKVVKTDEALKNVDCSRSEIIARVEPRSMSEGGTRAIGEEPCD